MTSNARRLSSLGASAAPALPALSALLVLGCGAATYQPSRTAKFELDGSAQEINDDDVRKAFEAKPQLPEQINVAYYAFDAAKVTELEAILKGLPGVASVYRIPPLVVTGQRRFDEPRPWDPPHEVSFKKLRLLAARANADVLFVLDDGHRVEVLANGLTALTPLVLPVFFVPFVDFHVKSYVDAFVIDTRNGYLYGHVAEEEQDTETYQSIYSRRAEALVASEWSRLRASTTQGLTRLLESERAASARRSPALADRPGCRPPPTDRPAPAPALGDKPPAPTAP